MSNLKKSSDKHAREAISASTVSSALPLSALVGTAIVILAIFIAYRPSINGGFVLDDDNLMTENPLIKTFDGLYRFWCSTEAQEFYPVSNTTFWMEWRLWERNPAGYHVTNLILHIIDVLLIWIILRKLSIPGAFFAAIIFAVHPVNVESVAWIAQVRNMLAMTFFLLSILWYLNAETAPPLPQRSLYRLVEGRWYRLSLAAFVLAMLSKGSTAVLPGLLLGIVWWLRPLTWRDLVRVTPFLVIAGIFAWVSVWFQTRGENLVFRSAGFTERLLGAGCVPWFYLYEALFPVDLYFVYPMWHIRIGSILWWLPLAAALAFTIILWLHRKRWGRPLLFAWGFFCVALLPVVGFTDVGFMRYSLVADHYQHIAIIGAIALPAAGWGIWRRRRQIRIGWAPLTTAILAAGSLACLTWRQNEIYTDEITLYHATLKKNPNCCMVHNNLGYLLANTAHSQKDMDEAIYHFRQAVNINPDYEAAQNNLGNLLFQIGRTKEAEDHLRQALRTKPNYPEALCNLGDLLLKTGRFQEAEEHLRQALQLDKNYPEALNIMGKLMLNTNRPQEAVEQFRQALTLKPNDVDIHNNLGVALVRTGRFYEAIEHYQQALRQKPDFAEGYFNLAMVYARLKRPSEALISARKALDLARSQGQTELAKTIEDWLKSGRTGI